MPDFNDIGGIGGIVDSVRAKGLGRRLNPRVRPRLEGVRNQTAWTAYAIALENLAIAAARRNNIALWYFPLALVGIYQDAAGTTAAAVNAPVGGILDMQYGRGGIPGQGFPAGIITASRRPTLMQAGADRYVATFVGTDNLLAGPQPLSPTEEYSVFGGYTSAAVMNQALIGRRSGPNGFIIRLDNSGALAALAFDGTSSQVMSLCQPGMGDRFLASMSARAGDSRAWCNGVLVGTLSTPYNAASNTILVGIGSERGNTNANTLNGAMAFAAYGTTTPPDSDRRDIERFGAFVTGIAYGGDN